MELPTHRHIGIICADCKKPAVIETQVNHYCSDQCFRDHMKAYWKDRWLKRKHDPVAKEAVRRAKKKYNAKPKL